MTRDEIIADARQWLETGTHHVRRSYRNVNTVYEAIQALVSALDEATVIAKPVPPSYGQIAYEAFRSLELYRTSPWADCSDKEQAEWEAIASAVVSEAARRR